jgi:hypothetical protein
MHSEYQFPFLAVSFLDESALIVNEIGFILPLVNYFLPKQLIL